jgi:hypothetical protein
VAKKSKLSKQNFQALRMEVKKMTCRSDTEFIEVKICSAKTPTKQLNILYLSVFYIKEVKSLSVVFKGNCEAG